MTDRITQLATTLRAEVEAKLISALETKGDYLSEEVVHQHVVKKITDQRDAIIKRILGVDTTWSQPEIKDGSPLSELIDKEIVGVLRERVRDALAKKLSKLDERRKLRATVDKAITNDLKQRLDWNSHELVREHTKRAQDRITKAALARLDAVLDAAQGETK